MVKEQEKELLYENEEEEMRSDLQKIEELLNMSEEEWHRQLEIILAEKRKELKRLKKEVRIKEEEVFSTIFCLKNYRKKNTGDCNMRGLKKAYCCISEYTEAFRAISLKFKSKH